MIPNRTDTVQVINNIDADATGQFSVDENSLAKIMSVLTNLYSDPEGAVVREYLTNALDAQIEAQQKDPNYHWRPIEVTTPSHFMKEYKVRDFGIGMSVDDIKDIYSKYGKSTKEQSNAVTGMLGLGSKCALTYTGQFTITGYKNGVRTRAVVSKDDNDIPVFMIVDTRTTSEPNGVEIAVPVRDRNSFAEKTRDFLRWWKPGQVLVNGNPPAGHGLSLVRDTAIPFTIGGVEQKHKVEVYLIEGNRYDIAQSYVIMGNVPYAVDSEFIDEGLRQAHLGFVAYVPMGAVDFPPSREKLFYNNRSKAAVKKISEGLFYQILDTKLADVTNAKTYVDAWNAYHKIPYSFHNNTKYSTLTYRGESFQARYAHDHNILTWDWNGNGKLSERSYVHIPDVIANSIVVTGVPDGTKPTSYFKKKVKHYIDSKNLNASKAILTNNDVDIRWLDHLPRVSADTIKDIKLPRSAGPSGPRSEAPYDIYTWDAAKAIAVYDSAVKITVPKGKTLCYISPQDMRETYRKQGADAKVLIRLLGEDYILAVMGTNRFAKFTRTYPKAVHARVAAKEVMDKLVVNASPAEFAMSQLGYGEQQFMEKVNYNLLLDQDLIDIAKMVQGGSVTSNYKQAENLVGYARRCEIHLTLPAPPKALTTNPCKRYPLIEHVGARNESHMITYINAVYKQNNP